jgi:hypothetical protein
MFTLMNGKNKLTLISVECIWNSAKHNALPDLIEFQGTLFCCFREGISHAGGGANGKIRILKSSDAKTWSSVAVLEKQGIDLRDPHFSITPSGRLMLTLGGSVYSNDDLEYYYPHVAFSDDAQKWSEVQKIPLRNEWIWRVTWNGNTGYGFSYRLTDTKNMRKPWVLTLFKTSDGLNFTAVRKFHLRSHPSEATIQFLKDGTMVALLRRQGHAWIGTSRPPYDIWEWNPCGHSVGGPNFLILSDSHMIAGGRYIRKKPKRKINESKGQSKGKTAVGFMTLKKYDPELFLPSGGDNSYPGMLYKDGMLYVCYYSSHEGRTSIYFATIKVTPP